jgi:hypothetical protein
LSDTNLGEDVAAHEQRQRDAIAQWVETNIGGRVAEVTRLRRWRPVWRVSYEKNGATRGLLVKSLRGWESIPYSLEHEMRLNQVLEANGIGVPHVYGPYRSFSRPGDDVPHYRDAGETSGR